MMYLQYDVFTVKFTIVKPLSTAMVERGLAKQLYLTQIFR